MSEIVDEVTFGFFPRFYVLCYVTEKMSYRFIELIREKLDSEKLKIEGIQFLELIPFKLLNYDTLGAVEIRVQELTLEYMKSIPYENQNSELYSFSQTLEKAIVEINALESENAYLDYHNPPYLVSIANSSSLGDIQWTGEKIEEYKKPLGRWIQFYSGQFSDYSDELYRERIQNNLSNRLSELHFIRVNSAFIYMKRVSWLGSDGDYMEKYFIFQILRTKALLLSFYVLNEEIDRSNEFLHSLKDPTLKQLEKEVESITKKKMLIDNLNDELIKEQMINRRAHSKKTVETCLKLYSINFVREETAYKFQRLQQELDNERAEQQQKFANSQKKWLLILNVLLGSSVLFTIVDKINTTYLVQGQFLYTLLGSGGSSFFKQYSEVTILLVLIVVAVVGGIGLVYNFLKHQVGFSSFFKKIGLNKDNEE